MTSDSRSAARSPSSPRDVSAPRKTLGITKSALADRRRHASFPRPLAELRCGPIWDRSEIEAYREARRRDPFAAYRWTPERWRRHLRGR